MGDSRLEPAWMAFYNRDVMLNVRDQNASGEGAKVGMSPERKEVWRKLVRDYGPAVKQAIAGEDELIRRFDLNKRPEDNPLTKYWTEMAGNLKGTTQHYCDIDASTGDWDKIR